MRRIAGPGVGALLPQLDVLRLRLVNLPSRANPVSFLVLVKEQMGSRDRRQLLWPLAHVPQGRRVCSARGGRGFHGVGGGVGGLVEAVVW
jgi:hypothetical protein